VAVETFGPVLWPSVHYESNRLLFNTYRAFEISQPIQYFASSFSAGRLIRETSPLRSPSRSVCIRHLNVAYPRVIGLRLAQLRLSTTRQLRQGSLVGVWRPVLGLRLCDRDGTLNGSCLTVALNKGIV
jgi:hypothetical protein